MNKMRTAMIGAVIAALMLSAQSPANAGGGNDSRLSKDLNISDDPKSSSSKKKNVITKKDGVYYTKRNFRKISQKDLKTAVTGIRKGFNITVEGFSKEMSLRLFETALLDQNRVDFEISALDSIGDNLLRRKEYLQRAVRVYEEVVRKIKAKGRVKYKSPEYYEIRRLKAVIKLLKYWVKHPSEGNFFF